MTREEIGRKVFELRTKAGMSQDELAKLCGFKGRSSINKIEMGVNRLSLDMAEKMANIFNVDPLVFIFGDGEEDEFSPVENLRRIPVYESVSAGFGCSPNDYIVGTEACVIDSDIEAQNTICVKVQGDSMQPLIFDGDIIQVLKCEYIDNNKIGVFLVDGEKAKVKKILCEPGFVSLISVNTKYPVEKFTTKDFYNRVRILGVVKKVLREL